MFQTSVDILQLFVRPPGNLLYFLAVIAVSLAALFMALGQRMRYPQDRGAGRYALAALGVVLTWVLLMAGALYAMVTGQDPRAILPPLERAASVASLLLVGWAFLTADHERWGRVSNVVLLLLLALVIGEYIVTGTDWPGLAVRMDFNLSDYGVAWTFIPTILSALGILLLLAHLRAVVDAPLKLLFFLVLLLGYGGNLWQISQGYAIGDYSGIARLAFLVALPIMPAVIYRMIIAHLETKTAPSPQALPVVAPPTPAPEDSEMLASPSSEREAPQLLRVLGLILDGATPADIPERVVTSAVEVMKADVGALLRLQDANYADIVFAYNRTMGRASSGISLNLDDQPTLVNAIERRLRRPLYPDRNADELSDLYTRLDMDVVGPTYFQPLVYNNELIAVLVIGFPYVGRELREEEERLLSGIGSIASRLLALAYEAQSASLQAEERAIHALVQRGAQEGAEDSAVMAAHEEMQSSLEESRRQIAELTQQVRDLKIELDYERARLAEVLEGTEEGLSISQRIRVLKAEQEHLRQERDRLASRLQEAETTLAGATTTDQSAMFKTVVQVLRREKDELMAERERLREQLAELRSRGTAPVPEVVKDVLESMSQEKARLEVERDQLSSQLMDIESQLKALGIEGGASGLVQLIAQLHEQRAMAQAKSEALKRERDALLAERTQLEDRIRREDEREQLIETMRAEIKNLAVDREALTKQRDKLRVERDEVLAKLDVVKQHRARLLAEMTTYQQELAEAHDEQARLRTQVQRLLDERSELISERDRLLAEKQAIATERDQLLARIEGDRDRLQQLGADGVGSLTKMVEELSEQRNLLERELNQTKARLEEVESQLEALRARTLAQADVRYQPDNAELLMGLVQELRTPMTSIMGYIDLLLGESAGILGEMQRKFLQRVSANVARLASMIDGLIRITALDTGQFTLTPEGIDIVGMIDDAITNANHQFREKGLTVKLNLQEDLPLLHADRDAVSQVIGQLLTNAYLVSPSDSEIIITTRRDRVNLSRDSGQEELVECVVVSVEDRGGGIAPEDEPRVFARKYKAENPLIQGLGDTGVGLSIAKALVEAHGGKLWLESREGIGSIFTFALPLSTELETEG